MAAGKKIYAVNWEDGDGGQGYYVRMTPKEAKDVLRFLSAAAEKNIIKNPWVDLLQGDRVTTAQGFVRTFNERYHDA